MPLLFHEVGTSPPHKRVPFPTVVPANHLTILGKKINFKVRTNLNLQLVGGDQEFFPFPFHRHFHGNPLSPLDGMGRFLFTTQWQKDIDNFRSNRLNLP